ncbi:hypothetical protein AC249_AIPGENE18006 [Exaiptasia diaphana]|nr:hypothetical protein AC249_AIPGENE18006 [Exaiptasia diaphana]
MSTAEEGTCSPSSYSQSGFQLQGHVIKKISTTSASACMQECELHNQCYSINYHNGHKRCELNDANHLTNPKSLTFSQGYDYKTNPTRSPSNCSITYCSRKTDKCLIDRNGRDYKCLSCKGSSQHKRCLTYLYYAPLEKGMLSSGHGSQQEEKGISKYHVPTLVSEVWLVAYRSCTRHPVST